MQEVMDPDTVYYYTYPDLNVDAGLEDYYRMIEANPEYDYYNIPELSRGPARADISQGRCVPALQFVGICSRVWIPR